MGNPHILAIPFPAQGHVIPLMELALTLVNHGIKVTFVNTEFDHKRILKAFSETDNAKNMINMVSIPDGLQPHEDRNDLAKLCETIFQVMPGKLDSLMEQINKSDVDKICCVIADENMGWALKFAERMGIRRAAFWPAAAASLALQFSIPKLIEDGIVNNDGTVPKNQIFQLSPTMPLINTASLIWACIGDPVTQKIIFQVMANSNESVKAAEWLLCNSTYELEPAAFSLFPDMLAIGPLLASNRQGKSSGYYWPEDSACLEWLNQQRPRSVIYIAFGSFTIFDEVQFQELALGLELSDRPFLWVVRRDTVDDTENAYPEGFKDRIKNRGRIVSWAPQQQVLSHPSIACFISHCGWNSTIEGTSNGVPFLCWPYFADQFINQSYICDVWKTGLGFNRDETGIIRKGEIKNKLDQLLSDESFQQRAVDLQEKAITKGGWCSNKNFSNFITWIKENEEDSSYRQATNISGVGIAPEDTIKIRSLPVTNHI